MSDLHLVLIVICSGPSGIRLCDANGTNHGPEGDRGHTERDDTDGCEDSFAFMPQMIMAAM
jgi:hypothetical protein